jgi:hypothetical protein
MLTIRHVVLFLSYELLTVDLEWKCTVIYMGLSEGQKI